MWTHYRKPFPTRLSNSVSSPSGSSGLPGSPHCFPPAETAPWCVCSEGLFNNLSPAGYLDRFHILAKNQVSMNNGIQVLLQTEVLFLWAKCPRVHCPGGSWQPRVWFLCHCLYAVHGGRPIFRPHQHYLRDLARHTLVSASFLQHRLTERRCTSGTVLELGTKQRTRQNQASHGEIACNPSTQEADTGELGV